MASLDLPAWLCSGFVAFSMADRPLNEPDTVALVFACTNAACDARPALIERVPGGAGKTTPHIAEMGEAAKRLPPI